jgi:hypothetical protein
LGSKSNTNLIIGFLMQIPQINTDNLCKFVESVLEYILQ